MTELAISGFTHSEADGPAVPGPVPTTWQRGRNGLTAVPEPRVPEPVQLYSLVVFALATHAPYPDTSAYAGHCVDCGHSWPCATVRLAARLREGF